MSEPHHTHRSIVADDARTRLARVEAWLMEQPGEVVLVAPGRGAADDLLRRACTADRGLFGIHRLTLPQLAAELATLELAERGLAPMNALGSEALAARSAGHCLAHGELEYFAPVADSPGFARALSRTLRELRAAQVDRDALAASGRPGGDLARLLTVYERELDRWSLIDPPGLLALAAEQASGDAPNHRLLGLPTVFLDPSPRSRVEQRLLRAVLSTAPASLTTLIGGDRVGLEAVQTVLRALGSPPTAESEPPQPAPPQPGTSKLERLRRRIFQPRIDLEDGPSDAEDGGAADNADSVEILSAPGEGRESAEIARRARDLAAEGTPFDHMAILLRDPHTYLPLLEEALRRAGVPAYFTRGSRRPHPAGRALLALLACAVEDLSAARFAEYLSLGQVPSADSSGAPPVVEVPWVPQDGDQMVFKSLIILGGDTEPVEEVPPVGTDDHAPGPQDETDGDPVIAGTLRAPRRWEQLLVDAAVLGGSDRWKRRLEGLGAELRLRLQHLDSDDHPRRRRLETQLEQLDTLKRFALPLVTDLEALPRQATWGEWLDALESLASRALRQPDHVLAVLAELRPMEHVGPVDLDEVRRTLEERLTELRAEPPQRRYARVFVGTVDEARGRSFDTVFLPGLAEGIFPRRASEDPLLLDVHRRQLDTTLPTRADRVEDERLLLRIAAGAAHRRLVVSYPNLDALQGRSRVPSFYALDLIRAAEGRLPDVHQLEERAARGADSILGWPAPQDPERAIDDAEYDLAIIEPLLRLPAAEAKARGRFLLESNEHLTRTLRTRFRRWRRTFSSADGIVKPDEATLETLTAQRLDRRSYSPTALQHFAACPYRFLLSAVHRLRPRDAVARLERLDPLTRGSLFHDVQFELFEKLRDHDLLPMRDDGLAPILDLADRTLDRVAGRYEDDLAPAIPRVWRSEIEVLRSDLRGWIHAVIAAREPWRPDHFEFGFGLAGESRRDGPQDRDSQGREAVVAGGKRLRGAIDLVEVDDARHVLRVTDHKTGLPPKDKDIVIGHGELLQPLLYALAAEVLLDKPVESGRLFYCTRRGRYEERVVPLTQENRQYVTLVLEAIDKALGEGFLPAAPREGACRHCDYRLVCGPFEELRFARKRSHNPHALGPLEILRQSP